jgi:pSer/pThr/pTyr-binding forkhead associated (FHA) protein
MSGVILLILRLAMALALYAFLGWAVYTLWRDMKRQSELIAARKIPELMLAVEHENYSASYSYAVPEIVIGREQACNLVLDEATVSAEHARFSYHHQNWWVEDLGSRNGTFMNFERLSTATIVVSGDELQLGQVLIRITIDDPSTAQSKS